jgi:hypothetical protein
VALSLRSPALFYDVVLRGAALRGGSGWCVCQNINLTSEFVSDSRVTVNAVVGLIF